MKSAAFLLRALLPFTVALAWSAPAAAQGTVTFGGGASTQTGGSASGSAAGGASGGAAGTADGSAERELLASGMGGAVPDDSDKEWAERDRKMNEGATLTGGVGLVHLQHAQGGAPGQFRVGFTTEYFSAGFLCTDTFPCRDPRNTGGTIRSDSSDHIGGHLTLSMQMLKWLEAYAATSAYANSNAANRPSLLQVLGDSVLGAKVHGPVGGKVLHVGGAFELGLVNGTGSVGLDGGGTSAKFRGLATADLRGAAKPIPLRFSLNLTYVLDNSGKVVEDTERARGTSITRIERFGLGINRVDHFDIGIGAEAFAAQEKVRPFIEYNIAIPVNRQNYLCRPNNPSGDLCLANNQVAPSSLTLGGRFFPWKRGFNLLLALDIGVSGVSTFIEEMKPEAPWMLYLGAGWAFDTQDRPPVIKERIVEKPVAVKAPGRKIRGFIHEENKTEGVPGAIVTWDNRPELTSLVSFPDGHFTTHELEEGSYVFSVKAEGYKPGQCSTSVVRPAQGPNGSRPGAAQNGQKSGGLNPTTPPGGTALPPSQPPANGGANGSAGGDVQLDCPLVALPRVGTIVGRVRDADTQAAIPNATVRMVDSQKKENSGAADQNGAFRFADVPPGTTQLSVDAEGYLALTESIDVKVRVENNADLLLKKRPKNANVTVGKGEIFIKQQIQFAIDSATILPESNGLLTEIADVLIKNPRIKRVEVQGHTDNTGTPDHNKQLSNDRAAAVVTWLSSHGVAADRMSAVGYGQTKPLVPNVTAGNRAKNRRVQFIIADQDPAAEVTPAKKAAPKK
jgi:outer membrane protein OmpA-like peptidoglycan-associated protein